MGFVSRWMACTQTPSGKQLVSHVIYNYLHHNPLARRVTCFHKEHANTSVSESYPIMLHEIIRDSSIFGRHNHSRRTFTTNARLHEILVVIREGKP